MRSQFSGKRKTVQARMERAAAAANFLLKPPSMIVLNAICTVCGQYRGSKIHRAHSRGSVKRT